MVESSTILSGPEAKRSVKPKDSSVSKEEAHLQTAEPVADFGPLRDRLRKFNQNGERPSVDRISAELVNLSGKDRAQTFRAMQQTYGNRYVQTVVSRSTGVRPDQRAGQAFTIGQDFSQIPVHSRSTAGLQAKLKVNTPGDIYEQEADRVADQVTATAVSGAQLRIQRFIGQPAGEAMAAPASVDHVLARSGRPLSPTLRKEMEERFGHDFSRVQVHTDGEAEQSARDVNANAYTVGHNIVFGAGQYCPNSHIGKRLLSHELAHVVQQLQSDGFGTGHFGEKRSRSANNARTRAAFGVIQRQVASKSIARHQATQKQSPIVRVERYWHSTSARVFLEDQSNEEVTFIDGSSLDTPSAPERRYEKVVDLVIDRSSPIRPHLEIASHGKGSRVKVETRLSPADRIARLPVNVQKQLADAFLTGTDDESNPQPMEFAADMGDRLKESTTAMAIQIEGRDPATLSKMKTVDQWVGGQKDALNKVGAWRRGKFTQLLNDIRQIGVTGPSASEDLDAQDIELVLAGVAGGQSDFQTFAEFKRAFEWKRRAGSASLPQDATKDPEFFIRNGYRRAWQAEAAGLRKLSRTADAAQMTPFIAVGGSALIGAGAGLIPAALTAGGTALEAGSWTAMRAAPRIAAWVGTHPFLTAEIGGTALSLGEKISEGDLTRVDVILAILTLGHASMSDASMMNPSGGDPSIPQQYRARSSAAAALALGIERAEVLPGFPAGGTTANTSRPVPTLVASPSSGADFSETMPASIRPATPVISDEMPGVVAAPEAPIVATKPPTASTNAPSPVSLEQTPATPAQNNVLTMPRFTDATKDWPFQPQPVEAAAPRTLITPQTSRTTPLTPREAASELQADHRDKIDQSAGTLDGLEDIFRRSMSGKRTRTTRPGRYQPVATRSASGELNAIMRSVDDPTVIQIRVIPPQKGRGAQRTPDLQIDRQLPNGSIVTQTLRQGTEIRTLTGARPRYQPTGSRQSIEATTDAIENAIRSKVFPSGSKQSQIAGGGNIKFDIQRPGADVNADIDNAVNRLNPRLVGAQFLGELHFNLPSNRTVVYVRSSNGTFVKKAP